MYWVGITTWPVPDMLERHGGVGPSIKASLLLHQELLSLLTEADHSDHSSNSLVALAPQPSAVSHLWVLYFIGDAEIALCPSLFRKNLLLKGFKCDLYTQYILLFLICYVNCRDLIIYDCLLYCNFCWLPNACVTDWCKLIRPHLRIPNSFRQPTLGYIGTSCELSNSSRSTTLGILQARDGVYILEYGLSM